MSESDVVMIICAAPCIGFWFGVIAGMMYSTFVYEDRASTKKHPRPGTQPFRPESKIKPFRKSSDMLTKIDDE